jgi:hypothetical protein
LALSFALAAILLSCGGDGEMTREERDAAALEKVEGTDRKGKLFEDVLDSLRAKKERYRITRDQYWAGRGGVLANDFFELWYPPGGATVDHGMYAFGLLVGAKKKFHRSVGRDPGDRVTIFCSSSMESFTEQTGIEWWLYSRIDGDEIHYQPIEILFLRNLADVAVPRSYHEWGIIKLSGGRAPHWFTEGMSSLLADEEFFLEAQLEEFQGENLKMTYEQIDSAFDKKNDKKAYRIAAYNAFRMARRLVAAHGREKTAEVMELMGEGESAKAAFEEAYGQPYDDLMEYVLTFTVNP